MTEGWIQVLSLFLANAGLIIWFRAESRADWRHMDNKLDASINGLREDVKAIQAETKAFHDAMHAEVKDFHGRLIEIEIKSKIK